MTHGRSKNPLRDGRGTWSFVLVMVLFLSFSIKPEAARKETVGNGKLKISAKRRLPSCEKRTLLRILVDHRRHSLRGTRPSQTVPGSEVDLSFITHNQRVCNM